MASIRYIGTGRKVLPVKISCSRNGGNSWQEREMVAGQTFGIPSDCTNLLIDNVPYDPKMNYVIRNGKAGAL